MYKELAINFWESCAEYRPRGRKLGVFWIVPEHLQDINLFDLIADHFKILKSETNEQYNVVMLICESDIFDFIPFGQPIPAYEMYARVAEDNSYHPHSIERMRYCTFESLIKKSICLEKI